MANGLFGKLPARRDFIAVNVPRALMTPWEAWIEAALVASQEKLGDDWHSAYYAAPIWRFWLGPDVCGVAAIGAVMPSRDGIGRAYPLTLVATGDLAPPDHDVRDAWFTAAETVLRAAAEPDRDYAETLAALEALPQAPAGWQDDAGQHSQAIPGGSLARPEAAASPGTFSGLRNSARIEVPGRSTCWWTDGATGSGSASTSASASGHAPTALVFDGLPRAELYSAMLTSDWPMGRSPSEVSG